jgi:hypothetical protein
MLFCHHVPLKNEKVNLVKLYTQLQRPVLRCFQQGANPAFSLILTCVVALNHRAQVVGIPFILEH